MHTDPLSLLARRLSGLAARRPGFALTLRGEAGIGKSFTARALLQGCSSASFSTPATRPLPSVLTALPRPKKCPAPLEGTLARLQRGETLEPNAVLDALTTLLAALAPFVLYLEDLHEVSPEQLETLTQLAERACLLRGVALLSSSRNAAPEGFETLALERLSPQQSRALLEAEVYAPLPPDALEWIYSKAAGNPLYTLEFFRSLSRAGVAWSDGRHWHWRAPLEDWVPVSVEALIERILLEAASTPDVQAALETLALLPQAEVNLQCAVSQLEPPRFETAVQHLRARGVLQASGFAHPLYREMTLKNLSAGRRQTLSRRALEALEGVNVEAAAEFVESAVLESGRALELLKRASSHAKERGDSARAGHFLAQAVEFTSGTERGELALEGSILLDGQNLAQSLQLARVAVEERPGHTATTLNLANKLVSRSRRVDDADPLLSQLSIEVQRSPEVFRAKLSFHMVCSDFQGVLELWRSAVSTPLDAASAYYVSASLVHTGHAAEADALAAQALEDLKKPPLKDKVLAGVSQGQALKTRMQLLNVRAIAQSFLGHGGEAERFHQEAIDLAREARNFLVLAVLLQNHALNLERTERDDERLAAARESVDNYHRVGDRTRALNVQTIMADIEQQRGEYAQSEGLLLESWVGLRGAGPSAFLLIVECSLVKLYLAWQHPPSRTLAEKFAAHALRTAQALNGSLKVTAYAHAQNALVEARWGKPARALEHAQQAAKIAGEAHDQLGFVLEEIFAAALEAQGQFEEGRTHFARAAALARDQGFTYDAQLYGLELDRLNHALESARERLTWFESRGLLHGVNVCKSYFPELSSSESQPPVQTQTLRLEVLGPLRLEGDLVRGGKRQELLKVLLEARLSGRSELSTLELLEALYPAEDEEHALNALKGTVFKARSSFGVGLIQTTSSGYALGAVSSDAEDFLQSGNTRLWRGAYSPLEGSGAVLETLSLALEAAVKSELERDPPEAARAARILCEMDPYSQGNLNLLCMALKASGNYKSLAREYQKGRIRLLEVGEILPATWADFLESGVSV